MTDNKVGSLEEEALKRKERLKNLKRKADPSTATDSESPAPAVPKPIFRNYKPADDDDEAVPAIQLPNVEAEVESQLAQMETPLVIEDIDITNLAPRKPDWDLKRDVAKKLQKLERRTQKAIAELIRERLKDEQENINILQAVNVGTSSASTADAGDEE